MSDFLAWRCMHEKEGENLFCPEEGCPKDYGCARDKGWKFGDPTPLGCLGYVENLSPSRPSHPHSGDTDPSTRTEE